MKPILFNTEMVRAILEGRKTVTRRVLKGYALENLELDVDGTIIGVYDRFEGMVRPVMNYAPLQSGDILYVRETWRVRNVFGDLKRGDRTAEIEFRAGGENTCINISEDSIYTRCWRPSIHMPKEAARIFLRVTDIRVERLQDMHLADCLKEGVQLSVIEQSDFVIQGVRARERFSAVWDSTIKPADRSTYGWAANPWVWVICFEQISKE